MIFDAEGHSAALVQAIGDALGAHDITGAVDLLTTLALVDPDTAAWVLATMELGVALRNYDDHPG